MQKLLMLALLALAGCTTSAPPQATPVQQFPPPPSTASSQSTPVALLAVRGQTLASPIEVPATAQQALFTHGSTAYEFKPRVAQPQPPLYAAKQPPPTPVYSPPAIPTRVPSYGCSSGNYYGAISCVTGLPKTTHVRSYFRKNGTFVRSHYRSRRR